MESNTRHRVVIKNMAVCGIAALLLAAFSPSTSQAFHNGGTGNCEGCHLQTVTDGGSSISGSQLTGSDPSSTCLRCHEAPAGTRMSKDYYISTNGADISGSQPPLQLTPGGDFAWLKKNYRWRPAMGMEEQSQGEVHGHNIVAMDYNYQPDSRHPVAPGGTYPGMSLSCISCHDPHGNYRRHSDGTVDTLGPAPIASGSYTNSPNPDPNQTVGSYRLLAGRGYQPKTAPGASTFINDPPAAVSPVSYNRSEATTETRVAYGRGTSEWCQNCHQRIHADGSMSSQHPAGNNARMSMETIRNYNSYIASGNLNGNAGTSYSSLVPYEMGTSDYTILKATANSNGSDTSGVDFGKGTPNVSCLSCHRAHAGGWDSMTRWNMSGEFMVYNGSYPSKDNGAPAEYAQGRSSAEALKAYYGRPASKFAYFQRNLCNKCHAKD